MFSFKDNTKLDSIQQQQQKDAHKKVFFSLSCLSWGEREVASSIWVWLFLERNGKCKIHITTRSQKKTKQSKKHGQSCGTCAFLLHFSSCGAEILEKDFKHLKAARWLYAWLARSMAVPCEVREKKDEAYKVVVISLIHSSFCQKHHELLCFYG